MKLYIRASEDEYIPTDFTSDFIDDVKMRLENEIISKYGRKYKDMIIDFDDVAFEGTRLQMNAILYNKSGKFLSEGKFKFNAYSDYWDEEDFQSHLNQQIHTFVEGLM